MENDAASNAAAMGKPRLYGIVNTYIQKHLPRDIHPAFKALRDREEAASTSPQIYISEDAALPLRAEKVQTKSADQLGESKEDSDEDDLPLYAFSHAKCPFCG